MTAWSFGRNRHGGAPTGAVPVARDGPCLANTVVAPRTRDGNESAPLGAPPTPRGAGANEESDKPGRRNAPRNEEDCAVRDVETRRCGDDDAGTSQAVRRKRGMLIRPRREARAWRAGSVSRALSARLSNEAAPRRAVVFPPPLRGGGAGGAAPAGAGPSPPVTGAAPPFFAGGRVSHPRRRRRHVDVIDAERLERVDQRVDHRRRRADGAGFTDALDPERVGLAGHLLKVSVDIRHRVGARHAVVHEAAGQELAGLAVVDLVLDQRLADPCTTPPWIWPRTIIGLSTRPRSSTTK